MVGDDEGFEFLPSDDIDEVEPTGAEDEAVHVQQPDESRGLLTVEAEEFDADGLDEDEADELGAEAGEAVATEAAAAPEGPEEHEDDLQEILRRQYGLVSEQPDEDLREDDGLRPPGTGEFVCRSCFLRRPASQLADPAQRACVDCASSETVAGRVTDR